MIVEILLVVIALLLLFHFGQKRVLKAENVGGKKKEIPGMKARHPRNGNNDDIEKAGNMSKFLRELHEKYGKIASFWEGPQFAVSFASPEYLKHQRQLWIVPYTFNKDFELLFTKEVIVFHNGEEARRRRKVYDQFYMQKACRDYTNCFVEVAREYTQKWEKLTRIPLEDNMAEVSITAITRTSFGDYFYDEKKLKHFQALNDYALKNAEPPPVPGSERYKKVVACVEEIKTIVTAIIEKRKYQKEDDKYLFIDLLLEDDFTDAVRLYDSMGFIGAGYYTTGSLMTWSIYHLAKHPEIQEKVYDEVLSVIGDDPKVEMEHVSKLVYLHQVLDESMRLYPGSQFAVRETDQDMEIDGYSIPKGTLMYQALNIMFHDPSIFPNPDRFDPDRFSPENSKGRSVYAFKPFGFSGKRQCPGSTYAYVEAKVCMSEWLRHYRFRLEPGQTVTASDTLMIAPAEEIWIRLEVRK